VDEEFFYGRSYCATGRALSGLLFYATSLSLNKEVGKKVSPGVPSGTSLGIAALQTERRDLRKRLQSVLQIQPTRAVGGRTCRMEQSKSNFVERMGRGPQELAAAILWSGEVLSHTRIEESFLAVCLFLFESFWGSRGLFSKKPPCASPSFTFQNLSSL
jgi:hypothetical protein